MDLAEARQRIVEAEATLATLATAPFAAFDTPHGRLHVWLTDRLRRKCRKGRVWKSNAMLAALKNAAYGYDRTAPRSRGGADGIYQVTSDFRPANSMMRKLFNQFLDKPDPLVALLATEFDVRPDTWTPVRLVSHHMRLLGVLLPAEEGAQLVLIDYDADKGV